MAEARNYEEYRRQVLDELGIEYVTEDITDFKRWKLKLLRGLASIFTDESTINNAISSWMDEHPEVTVVDGSITEPKFSGSLKAKTIKDYVTPEMFGAVGNGVIDDTQAIQNAIASGKPVYMANKYYINGTINILNDETVIKCDGSILFDSDIVIFNIESNYNDIYIKEVKGLYYQTTDNVWSCYGTLFKLNADEKIITYNTLTVIKAEYLKKVFDCYANGTFGVMYNKMYFNMIVAEYGIYFSCGSTGLPWINANQFYGGRIRGNYGVCTVKGSSQTDPYNDNKFINIGFEGVQCAIKGAFLQYNSFQHIRTSESLNGSYWIDLATDCNSNHFVGDCNIEVSKINDLNNSAEPNVYEFKRFIFTYNGSNKTCGQGQKVFKNSAGWTAENVMPAMRLITITGDGNQHDLPAFGLLKGWFVTIKRNGSGLAIINMPDGSGYGYGGGAEIIYLKVEAGSNNWYIRSGGSNISKAQNKTDSGYFELRYMNNAEWVLTKVSDL